MSRGNKKEPETIANTNTTLNISDTEFDKNDSIRKERTRSTFNGFSSIRRQSFDVDIPTASSRRANTFIASGNHISSLMENERYSVVFVKTDWRVMNGIFEDDFEDELDEEVDEQPHPKKTNRRNRGSTTGLSQASQEAVQWVHKIPYWAKPLMSSVFCLLDMVFRMLTILYLAASVAQLLMGGLDLVFSVLAARAVRKRHVTRERWAGSFVMVIGLVIVALSEMFKGGNETSKSLGLGIVFVLLRVIMGVAKDLTQELFMQEATFPASLLLGMEGLYALLIGLPLYFLVGPRIGYDPVSSFQKIGESAGSIGYTIFMLAVMFTAGMYAILSTGCTSAMTRNLWKNFRGFTVWMVALIIYYSTGDPDLGEPWTIPGSLFILGGFVIMTGAVYIYYGGIHKLNEKKPQVVTEEVQVNV